MIRKLFLLCLMAVIMFCSCSDKLGGTCETQNSQFVLEVSVPLHETKITGIVDETSVRNYQVFLYNADGVLEDYVNQKSSDISLKCTEGDKTVLVLVNAPDMESGITLSSLLSKRASLADNEVSQFIMSGKVTTSVSKDGQKVIIPVSRVVSKVRLSNLVTNFEMPQYSAMNFTVSAVYLINVPADGGLFTALSPTVWYHKQKYVPEDNCPLVYDFMNNKVITPNVPYSEQNSFYCFPNIVEQDTFSKNWSERRTRLVVEARLGGNLYYYPVTLPTMEANKIYDVNLTVTRPGATQPDAEVDKFAGAFSISVNDWEEGGTIVEEI